MSETVEKFDGWAIEMRPGDVAVYLVRGDTEISARPNCGTVDIENDDAGFFTYPPRAAIESLLRRAALALEAQAPSGKPWRPAVGGECFYYTVGEWRLCRRLEDDDSDIPQRFEKTDRRGSSICYCNATYDGIRPLGSLPVPPSCGGEPEPRDRAEPIAAPSPAVWGAAFEALGREPEKLDAAGQAVATWLAGRPAVSSERPGLARLLEWARGAEREADAARDAGDRRDGAHHDGQAAYADCVREIEREIAALVPIAEDLRTPEPWAFEGAVIVGVDLARGEDVSRVAAVVSREAVNGAVREALAELRGMLEDSADENHPLNPANTGLREAVGAIDRLAERFK